MEKKYKTEPEGNMLRIIALKDFADIKKGEKGGLIEKEENLSQEGDCWVYEGARIFDDAYVSENAKIYGSAKVYGNARVYGNAQVWGAAQVYGSAQVWGAAQVYGRVCVYEHANVCDYAQVYDNAWVYGNANVCGFAQISENAKVWGNAHVFEAWVYGKAKVFGNVKLWSTNKLSITSSIKDSKDYVILAIGKKFYIYNSHVENAFVEDTSIFDNNYTKNIKTIRQLYGEKV